MEVAAVVVYIVMHEIGIESDACNESNVRKSIQSTYIVSVDSAD